MEVETGYNKKRVLESEVAEENMKAEDLARRFGVLSFTNIEMLEEDGNEVNVSQIGRQTLVVSSIKDNKGVEIYCRRHVSGIKPSCAEEDNAFSSPTLVRPKAMRPLDKIKDDTNITEQNHKKTCFEPNSPTSVVPLPEKTTPMEIF
jgi:hypothetical protein